jgi:predicted secreted protein
MNITSAIVLYSMIWFLILFLVLPMRLVTQAEHGEIVPGTPESAPHDAQMGRKIKLTTIVATALWAVVSGIIVSGVIEVRDFDWLHQLPPEVDGRGE